MDNVSVPIDIMTRIKHSQDKARECVNIAAEMVSALKNAGCSGVLIAPLGWEHKLPDILDGPKA